MVKRDANGALEFGSLFLLFKAINDSAKEKLQNLKEENRLKRVELLKAGNEEEYRKAVTEQLENDRDAFSEQFSLVLSENGVDEKEFETALNSHMRNPAFQRLVMQVMHPA